MEDLLYPLLKVPFEKANKSFRLFHKHVTREIAGMQKSVTAFQVDQPPAQHARVDETIESLENLAERIRSAQQEVKQFVSEQQKDINSCVLRAQYVRKYQQGRDALAASAHAAARSPSGNPHVSNLRSNNEEQSLENDRLIADYLLSHGYIKSSKLIQESKGVEFVVDHDLHMQCHAILNDLHARNVSTAIQWCLDNASRLRRLSSQLEFQLRLQEFVELVRSDKKLEAVDYARLNLTPISMQNEDEASRNSMMESIREAMGTLAFNPDQCGVESCSRLFSLERWETLKKSFRATFCLAYGIHSPPALSIALHAGISSLNTRACRRNRDLANETRKRRLDGDENNEAEAGENESGQDRKRQSESESVEQQSKKTKIITIAELTTKNDKSSTLQTSQEEAPPLCPTCSEIGGKLCEGLPFAHHPHSRLVCRLTQGVMDEHNPPVALPNGYVFSRRAIQQLSTEDDKLITCPVTKDKYATSALKPVYIL